MFDGFIDIVVVGEAVGRDLDLTNVGLAQVAPVVAQSGVHSVHAGAVWLRRVVAGREQFNRTGLQR